MYLAALSDYCRFQPPIVSEDTKLGGYERQNLTFTEATMHCTIIGMVGHCMGYVLVVENSSAIRGAPELYV